MPRILYFLNQIKIGLCAALFVALFLIVGILIWIAVGTATINGNETLDAFETSIYQSINKNISEYNFWYKFNVTLNFLSIFAALLASIVTASITKENLRYLKYYVLFLTFFASSAMSTLSALRVQENIEAFIELNGEFTKLQYKYLIDRAPHDEDLFEGNKDKSPDSKDIQIPIAIIKLQEKYYQDYGRILNSRMRLWLNIGNRGLLKSNYNEKSQ